MANSSAAHREAEAETHGARQGKWRRVKQGRVGKLTSSKEAAAQGARSRGRRQREVTWTVELQQVMEAAEAARGHVRRQG